MTRQEREQERRRQSVQLALVVGAGSQLPRRPRGELRFPPFRTLLKQ